MSDMKSQPRHAALPVTGMPFVLILSALMAFTSLSTDIYLPALPAMQKDLQGNTELTITGFLLGFCIAQLVWGPVSDHLGRRKPLMIGMVLFIVGSIGCSLSHNITQIVFWRVFQALGACTGPMLARAMIRDLFTRTRAAQMLSVLMMIMSVAPIAGPLMGANHPFRLMAGHFLATGRAGHSDADFTLLAAGNTAAGETGEIFSRQGRD